MKKRLLSFLLAGFMVMTLLAGCTKEESTNADADKVNAPTSTDTKTTKDEKPYHAVLVYLVASDSQDQEKVNERFNELTREQLNMEVTLMPMTWSTWQNQMQLMLSGGEQVDLFPMLMSNAATYVDADYITNIAPYLETNGQYLLENVGKDDIWCCSIGDFLWGIPTMKERANPVSMCVRTDILKEAGIDPGTIKSYEDMTEVYKKVKALHPDMIMYGGSSTSAPASQTNELDILGDRFGVLENFGQTTKVTNYFESDLYKRLVNLARKWYEAGYTSKDMATSSDGGETLMKAGNLFSFAVYCKPNTKQEKDDQTGFDTTILKMEGNELNTWGTGSLGYSVGSSSSDPAKAIELLNWISKTEEANDLLNWGVKDIHWVEKEDGTIDFPEGVTAQSSGYHQNFGFALPNQFNSHVWTGNSPDIWEQYKKFRDESTKSMAYGFAPDLSNYATEIAALTEVRTQYEAQIATGSVDPVPAMKEYNDALYGAGLQKIMDEKQKQLDEWLAKQQK